MKNPFPEDFSVPSPALSSKKSATRSSIQKERNQDHYDQFQSHGYNEQK
jgi:hypothetical protein